MPAKQVLQAKEVMKVLQAKKVMKADKKTQKKSGSSPKERTDRLKAELLKEKAELLKEQQKSAALQAALDKADMQSKVLKAKVISMCSAGEVLLSGHNRLYP